MYIYMCIYIYICVYIYIYICRHVFLLLEKHNLCIQNYYYVISSACGSKVNTGARGTFTAQAAAVAA